MGFEIVIISFASPDGLALGGGVAEELLRRGQSSICWLQYAGEEPWEPWIRMLPQPLIQLCNLGLRITNRITRPLQDRARRSLPQILSSEGRIWSDAPTERQPWREGETRGLVGGPNGITARGVHIEKIRGLKSRQARQRLKELSPRWVAYFGGLLPPEVFQAATGGFINTHAGARLPAIRGNDALDWALLNDQPLFVNVHLIRDKVDSGELLIQRELSSVEAESYSQLLIRRDKMRIETMAEAIDGLMKGTLQPTPQGIATEASYFNMHPMLKEVARRKYSRH